ncbi:MAG: hypothetical protein KJ077_08100 [Anaerolineae bacterium]|nr:hypothetical protein [Anaerolineae bacterium]
MKLNQIKTLGLVLLVAAALIVGTIVPVSFAADGGRPDPGTVQSWQTWPFSPTTYIVSGTTNTASPRVQSGVDVTKVSQWNAADIFLTGDISGTTIITLTPQFSPDASNWADATYDYVADTLVSTTEVLTSDGLVTATTTTSSSSAPATETYQIVLSADGTDYLRLPIAGEYMRLKVEVYGDGGVTTTAKVTLRNN